MSMTPHRKAMRHGRHQHKDATLEVRTRFAEQYEAFVSNADTADVSPAKYEADFKGWATAQKTAPKAKAAPKASTTKASPANKPAAKTTTTARAPRKAPAKSTSAKAPAQAPAEQKAA